MDFVGAMHFGSEWSITKLYNMNSCTGMQCMAVDEQYLYNVKVNSFTEADAFIARTGNVYTTAVAGIAAKNLSDTLYVAAVYSDGAQSHCSGVLAYSIGEYCGTQISAGTEASSSSQKQPLFTATMPNVIFLRIVEANNKELISMRDELLINISGSS